MEDEWRKYRCDNCTRRFGIEEYLKIHKLVSHSKETSNVCNMCEKEFPASRALEEHMIYHIKKNSKQYYCEECKMSFSTSTNLTKHINHIHNKEKTFQCDNCDRFFKTDAMVKKHEKCLDP